MLRCREVVGLLASDEWRDASLVRRLGLRLHLAMCRYCRSYARQLRGIGRAAQRLYRSQPEDARHAHRVLDAVRRAAEKPESR